MSAEDEAKAFEVEAARLEAEAEKEEKEKKKQKKEKKDKKKVETFNQLDEKFQVNPGMDLEIIFPEEKEMIEDLRSRISDLIYFTDKWIVFFLCARRHDLEATFELITKHLSSRRQYGCHPKDVPDIMSDAGVNEMRDARVAFRAPHMRDKHDRLILYFWMARNFPQGRPLKSMLLYSFWETDYLVETEPLAYLRNGTVYLMDQKDFSIMKNLDTSSNGRAWGQAISGLLPNRIRDMYIWNGGMFFSLMMKAAKWILPKKLVKRMHSIKPTELFDFIEPKYILKDYGGEMELDWEKARVEFEKANKQLAKAKKVMRKAVRNLKKELKAELTAVDELNASMDGMVIANEGPHKVEAH